MLKKTTAIALVAGITAFGSAAWAQNAPATVDPVEPMTYEELVSAVESAEAAGVMDSMPSSQQTQVQIVVASTLEGAPDDLEELEAAAEASGDAMESLREAVRSHQAISQALDGAGHDLEEVVAVEPNGQVVVVYVTDSGN